MVPGSDQVLTLVKETSNTCFSEERYKNGTTHHTYEEIVTQLFQQQETLKPQESIVIKVYETLKT